MAIVKHPQYGVLYYVLLINPQPGFRLGGFQLNAPLFKHAGTILFKQHLRLPRFYAQRRCRFREGHFAMLDGVCPCGGDFLNRLELLRRELARITFHRRVGGERFDGKLEKNTARSPKRVNGGLAGFDAHRLVVGDRNVAEPADVNELRERWRPRRSEAEQVVKGGIDAGRFFPVDEDANLVAGIGAGHPEPSQTTGAFEVGEHDPTRLLGLGGKIVEIIVTAAAIKRGNHLNGSRAKIGQ